MGVTRPVSGEPATRSADTRRPFTVVTHNTFDRAAPPAGTVVAVQERPPLDVLRRGLPDHDHVYPERGHLAVSWDPQRLTDVASWTTRIYRSGAWHGQPGTTPTGYMQVLTGELDGRTRVAVINVHLVNNAFGPVKRGERELRRKLWWQGWGAVKRQRRLLRRRGFRVFVVGDLNRKARFWRSLRRVLGAGYDQLRYPSAVELLGAHRPDPQGSDHRPIVARFRFR